MSSEPNACEAWNHCEKGLCNEHPSCEKHIHFIHVLALRNDVVDSIRAKITETATSEENLKRTFRHLAITARGFLCALLASKYRFGTKIQSSEYFVNAGIGEGLWAPLFPEDSASIAQKMDEVNIQYCFSLLEGNFYHFLNGEGAYSRLEAELTEITTCVTAIYILLERKTHLDNYKRKAINFFESIGLQTPVFMIQMSYDSYLLQFSSVEPEVLQHAKCARTYFHDAFINSGEAEATLLEGLIKSKLTNFSRQEAAVDLSDAYSQFVVLSELGKHRAALAIAAVQPGYDQNRLIEEAIKEFARKGRGFWKVRGQQLLAVHYFESGQDLKCNKLLCGALDEAKALNSYEQCLELSRSIQELHSRVLSERKDNTIMLIKAFPLNKISSIQRYPSTFKEDLLYSLKFINDPVAIRLDIGTRENLRFCFESNTKILHISSEIPCEDGLVLEDRKYRADKISFSELEELLKPYRNTGVELVVLAMPKSKQLAQFFYTNIGIKHVIGFDFEYYPYNGRPLHVYIMFEKGIHKFCVALYRNIANKRTVKEAFDIARGELENFLYLEYSDFENNVAWADSENWRKTYKYEGADLVEENSPLHNVKLFSESPEFPEDKRGFFDLSPIRGLSSIQKPTQSYIGRLDEMYLIAKELSTEYPVGKTPLIHLYGRRGIGKTSLIERVGYHLYSRRIFTDGIYHVSIHSKLSMREIYQSFQEKGLPFYSDEYNPAEFIDNKNILLMLDDCDALLQEADHTFRELIEKLQETKMRFVFVTNRNFDLNVAVKKVHLTGLNDHEMEEIINLRKPELVKTLSRFQLTSMINKSLGTPNLLIEKINEASGTTNCEDMGTLRMSSVKYNKLPNSIRRSQF